MFSDPNLAENPLIKKKIQTVSSLIKVMIFNHLFKRIILAEKTLKPKTYK